MPPRRIADLCPRLSRRSFTTGCGNTATCPMHRPAAASPASQTKPAGSGAPARKKPAAPRSKLDQIRPCESRARGSWWSTSTPTVTDQAAGNPRATVCWTSDPFHRYRKLMPVNFRSSEQRGGERRRFPMDAQDFRAQAQRCRELSRIAVRSEVREQLRQWVDDFEAEAEAVERRHPLVGL